MKEDRKRIPYRLSKKHRHMNVTAAGTTADTMTVTTVASLVKRFICETTDNIESSYCAWYIIELP
jgi:hypothetical protein